MVVNIDITKAYDRQEEKYIRVNNEKGVIWWKNWIQLITMCVRTVSTRWSSISIYIYPSCGYIESYDELSGKKNIKGRKISNNGSFVRHLLFTDDSLFFCQATQDHITQSWTFLARNESVNRQ